MSDKVNIGLIQVSHDAAEEIPHGPTTSLFQDLAKELEVVIILPELEFYLL